MQRARRLASIAVVASVAVAGLTACRSSPQVAAYVGDQRITEERVTDVLDDAKAKPASGGQETGITRQSVVNTLVGLRVLQAVAQSRNVTAASIPADSVAQSLGLRSDAELVGLTVQYEGLFSALNTGVQAVTPTQADLRDVYDKITTGGGNTQHSSFADWSGSLASADTQTLGRALGLRKELEPAIAKVDTVVNPKYDAPTLQLVSASGSGGKTISLEELVLAPVKGDPAVTDAPSS